MFNIFALTFLSAIFSFSSSHFHTAFWLIQGLKFFIPVLSFTSAATAITVDEWLAFVGLVEDYLFYNNLMAFICDVCNWFHRNFKRFLDESALKTFYAFWLGLALAGLPIVGYQMITFGLMLVFTFPFISSCILLIAYTPLIFFMTLLIFLICTHVFYLLLVLIFEKRITVESLYTPYIIAGRGIFNTTTSLFDLTYRWVESWTPERQASFLARMTYSFLWVLHWFLLLITTPLRLYYGHFMTITELKPYDATGISFVKTRLALSIFVFMHVLLGIKLFWFLGLLGFTTLLSMYYTTFSFPLWVFYSTLQTLVVAFYCILRERTPDFFSEKFKRLYLDVVFWSASFGQDFDFVFTLKGVPTHITRRFDPSRVNRGDLNRFFKRFFYNWHPLHQAIILVLMLLYAVAFVLRLPVRVASGLLGVLNRTLSALMWAGLVWFIPEGWFAITFASVNMLYLENQTLVDDSVLGLHRLAKAFGVSAMYGYSRISELDPKHVDYHRLSQLFIKTWLALTRKAVLRIVLALDDIALPEIIQRAYEPPTLDSIRSTYAFLKDCGFPVDESFIASLDAPNQSPYLAEWGSFREWLLGTTNNRLGFRPVPVQYPEWLKDKEFFPDIPGYIHSTTFTGVIEEIKSLAGYWTGNDKISDIPEFDDVVDGAWEGVKRQYQHSRLASFDEIYKAWVKKYNMGFGFIKQKKGGRLYQLARSTVIDLMGGRANFKRAINRVVKYSQSLHLPAPVFTKWETLKHSKAIQRAVRTVVGSAFTHDFTTKIFNFKPNHNYQYWETPMKVGMPIMGRAFNRLWCSFTGHQHVRAGDMKNFDRSLPPVMLKMVAEIRKRGYTLHKDYHKICQLIDVSYRQLLQQPMGFKNFGDLATKAQGFSTGHSSTTPDNSMSLLLAYLYAWVRVTGLRAREFYNFNTLANFGDDHLLGYDSVFGWSFEAAQNAMAELGIIMRDEAPGEDSLPYIGQRLPPGVNSFADLTMGFLGKKPLPMTAEVKHEIEAAFRNKGLEPPPLTFATIHDKKRLLGKVKGQTLRSKTPEQIYESLLSYLYLSAHHRDENGQLDVYPAIYAAARDVYLKNKLRWIREGRKDLLKKKPPTYHEVIRAWYAEKPDKTIDYLTEDFKQDDDDREIVVLSTPDTLGIFVRWISDLPTLLSPRYSNTRWADWLQHKLHESLSWPLSFMAYANGTPNDLESSRLSMSRTPYAFLRSPSITIEHGTPFGSLILRHWVFMAYTRFFNPRRGNTFSILDLVRVLDYGFINLLFMITGRVTEIVVELDLHVLDTILIYLLSYLHSPIDIPIFSLNLWSPSYAFGVFITWVIAILSPSGSIDAQPFDENVRNLVINPKKRFTLDAPTGVGKSTRLVLRASRISKRRVVVIVPRHFVAVSVGTYMQGAFPFAGVGISTEGHTFAETDRIVYCTVQSLFANPKLRSPSNLFILDESHINEEHYIVARNFFNANQQYAVLAMSGTPTPDLRWPILQLPAVSAFSVIQLEYETKDLSTYIDQAARFINGRSRFEKALIFIPSIKMAYRLQNLVRARSAVISSQDRNPDQTASVFISTSVTDAGVTLPDLDFVLSPDVDVTVTSVETADGTKTRAYYFKLSKETIRQRKGRTGRTSDGIFILYRLSDVETQDLSYSFLDYMNKLRPATVFAYPYFPERLQSRVPEQYRASLLKSWDMNDSLEWDIADMFLNLWKMTGDDPFEEQRKEGWIPSNKLTVSDPDAADDYTTEKPYNAKDLDDWNAPINPDDPDVTVKPTPVKAEEPPQEVFRPQPKPPVQVHNYDHMDWQRVSGAGLLCGARAAIGAIYQNRDIVVPLDYFTNQLRQVISTSFLHQINEINDYDSFFAANQMADVCLYYYNVHLLFFENGRPSYHVNSVPDKRFNPGIGFIRVLPGHYEYCGKQVPPFEHPNEVPIHFERIMQFRFANDWWCFEPGVPELEGGDLLELELLETTLPLAERSEHAKETFEFARYNTRLWAFPERARTVTHLDKLNRRERFHYFHYSLENGSLAPFIFKRPELHTTFILYNTWLLQGAPAAFDDLLEFYAGDGGVRFLEVSNELLRLRGLKVLNIPKTELAIE